MVGTSARLRHTKMSTRRMWFTIRKGGRGQVNRPTGCGSIRSMAMSCVWVDARAWRTPWRPEDTSTGS